MRTNVTKRIVSKTIFTSFLVLFLAVNVARANNPYQQQFNNAYTTYPNIPAGVLEALAYSASHMENINASAIAHGHSGPERFGIFALVEDGKGYFKNTLAEVCALSNISTVDYKKNVALQIMAYAKYLSEACKINNVTSITGIKSALLAVSEIPSNGLINNYAKELQLYDTYAILSKGVNEKNILLKTQPNLSATDWFSPSTYQVLSAPTVSISTTKISGGNATFGAGNTNPPTTQSTDYTSALWVASPNFNSRGTTAITDITVHTTQGSYAGAISWFQNTAAQVSAHYVIRSSDGQITQMVLETNRAWHVGNANSYTIGLEHEGYVNNASWYTDVMYKSSAALVRDICKDRNIDPKQCFNGAATATINILPKATRIKGHQHYSGQSHTDPGVNWDWAKYYNFINPCSNLTNLATSGLNLTTATLSWKGNAGSYAVRVRPFNTTNWTKYSTTQTTLALTNLQSGIKYEWDVQGICSATVTSEVSAINSFTTLSSICAIPTGLNTTLISTSNATLNWNGSSSSVKYLLEWRPTGGATWNNITLSTTSYSVTGLKPSTTYEYRVTTICSPTNKSAVSPLSIFTTQATCFDAYENNNTSAMAKAITSGQVVYGKICSSTDVDWFKFSTSSIGNIAINLTQLPADYNVELFYNGAYIAGSYSTLNKNELINRLNAGAGNYLVRIYPSTSTAINTALDYKLIATYKITPILNELLVTNDSEILLNTEIQAQEAVMAPVHEIISATEETVQQQTINSIVVKNTALDNSTLKINNLYPNPAIGSVNIELYSINKQATTITIIDAMGKIIIQTERTVVDGDNLLNLDLTGIVKGNYFISVRTPNANVQRQLMITQ